MRLNLLQCQLALDFHDLVGVFNSTETPVELVSGFNGYSVDYLTQNFAALSARYASIKVPAGAYERWITKFTRDNPDVAALMSRDELRQMAQDTVRANTPYSLQHKTIMMHVDEHKNLWVVGIGVDEKSMVGLLLEHTTLPIDKTTIRYADLSNLHKVVSNVSVSGVVGVKPNGDHCEYTFCAPTVWTAGNGTKLSAGGPTYLVRQEACEMLGRTDVYNECIGLYDTNTGCTIAVKKGGIWLTDFHTKHDMMITKPNFSGSLADDHAAAWYEFIAVQAPRISALHELTIDEDMLNEPYYP